MSVDLASVRYELREPGLVEASLLEWRAALLRENGWDVAMRRVGL